MINVVLIDDEVQSLKVMVIELAAVTDEIEVVASICEPEKAVTLLPDLKPDSVFLLIQITPHANQGEIDR